MEQHHVVPQVIPSVPKDVTVVKYGDLVVNLGNELTPTQVQSQPTEVTWKSDENELYTLCFTDPDVPSREDNSAGEFQHWLVVNIPGAHVSAGDTITEYLGSGPPKGTGFHRYVYVVYKQPGRIDPEPEREAAKDFFGYRKGFKINKFAQKYDLGAPVSANFYQAEFDDYCIILHRNLSQYR